jgi:hypothetical protein
MRKKNNLWEFHSISFSRCESMERLSTSSSSGGNGGLLYKRINFFSVLSSTLVLRFFSFNKEINCRYSSTCAFDRFNSLSSLKN